MILSSSPDGIVDKGRGSLFSSDSNRVGFASLFVCRGQGNFIHDDGVTKSTTGQRDDAYSWPLAKSD